LTSPPAPLLKTGEGGAVLLLKWEDFPLLLLVPKASLRERGNKGVVRITREDYIV